MQMAQRKRQHEREEASEQEGEDEEYSEEEEEEYFEEGEEEERSFDPEEEASESDDSRDWKRRSMYKGESFRRPRRQIEAPRILTQGPTISPWDPKEKKYCSRI